MSRTVNFFLSWSAPTTYAKTYAQSHGINTDLMPEALTSKDFHKYEPRRAKIQIFRDDWFDYSILNFNYIIDKKQTATKWNKYKVCIKDGDTILFRGVIDNSTIKFTHSRRKVEFIAYDLITFLNYGMAEKGKEYDWQELATPVELAPLLGEIIEDSLEFADQSITGSDWVTYDYTVPAYTFANSLVYRFDVVNFEAQYWQYDLLELIYAFRDDGDYLRFYAYIAFTNPDEDPQGYYFRRAIYVLDAGQCTLDYSDNYTLSHYFTTTSGYVGAEGDFPQFNNMSIQHNELLYQFSPTSGQITATGTMGVGRIFLSRSGMQEPAPNVIGELTAEYNRIAKVFKFSELFNMIMYLWNLAIYTGDDGKIKISNKSRAGISASAVNISDSDLCDTEYSALLYTPPDVEKILSVIDQKGLNTSIINAVKLSYKDVYGKKVIKTTIPTDYSLGLEDSIVAHSQQWKISKIKRDKSNTFYEIEGWEE